MRKLWETGILLFAVAGFWGMIYPDLCFISDVCHVEEAAEDSSAQTGAGEKAEKQYGQGDIGISMGDMEKEDGSRADAEKETDIYTRLCEAEPGQIKVKSKFLELFRR